MFKYALLAAIAAAAEGDSTDPVVKTYSGDGVTVSDTESNGLMTTKLGFKVTTNTDSVANESTVGVTLSSGSWGTDGTAMVRSCIKIASNTALPYECRETNNGAEKGDFTLY